MMSTNLDTDPFSDFSYGYITGATAQDALNFVDKIIYAETHAIQNYPLKIGGYAASSINFVYPGGQIIYNISIPQSVPVPFTWKPMIRATGPAISFQATPAYMLDNKLLDIGHNGDPHMLWLFEEGNSTPILRSGYYDSTKSKILPMRASALASYDYCISQSLSCRSI